MAPDPRFFSPRGPFTLEELSSISGAVVARQGDGPDRLDSVAALHIAAESVSFLGAPYTDQLRETGADAASFARRI